MFLVLPCSRLCQIHESQVLSREWRCNWSSADRQCSNYIWVINNFIGYWGVPYIRGFMVIFAFSKDAPYLAITGELQGNWCEYFGEYDHNILTHWLLGDEDIKLKWVILKLISRIADIMKISCVVVLRWMPQDFTDDWSTLAQVEPTGIILYLCPPNERRRYIVTSSLIGLAHTQNDPWTNVDHVDAIWYN